MERLKQWRTVGVTVLFIMAAVAGCGKKGPPLPPLSRMVPPPARVTAHPYPDRVEITWTLDPRTTAGRMHGNTVVEIFRADISPDGKTCAGCPLTFEKRAEVSLSACLYNDAPLEEGWQYVYKLRIRQNHRNCSEFSESVTVGPNNRADGV